MSWNIFLSVWWPLESNSIFKQECLVKGPPPCRALVHAPVQMGKSMQWTLKQCLAPKNWIPHLQGGIFTHEPNVKVQLLSGPLSNNLLAGKTWVHAEKLAYWLTKLEIIWHPWVKATIFTGDLQSKATGTTQWLIHKSIYIATEQRVAVDMI